MVSDHEEAVDNFQDRMKSTRDSELKSWINETLPKLKMHLEDARRCLEQIRDRGNS